MDFNKNIFTQVSLNCFYINKKIKNPIDSTAHVVGNWQFKITNI